MEPLLDPVGDRVMKDIVPPPHKPISDELLYPNKSIDQFYWKLLTFTIASTIPNWELLKNHMYREGRVSKEHCQKILRDTLALISNQWKAFIFYRKGTKSFESTWSCDSRWRYSWSILRFCENAGCRWQSS